MDRYSLTTIFSVILLCTRIINTQTQGDGVSKEYCQGTSFTPQCGIGEVVEMQSAFYGSVRLGNCITEDPFGHVGCSVDVLSVADKHCSGRRECEIRVPNAEMDNLRSCKHDLSRYFEAAYWCRKVYKPPQVKCSRSAMVSVSTKSGYLASLTSQESNCGLTDSPWILEAKKGQTINLTLTYFNWQNEDDVQSPCSVKLGYLFDLDTEDIVNICGGSSRVTHLYTTHGNQAQLLLDRATLREKYFMIKYEASGCPIMNFPENTWSEISGDILTIGCTNGPTKWNLKCRGNHWIGIMQTCSNNNQIDGVTEDLPIVDNPQSVKDGQTNLEDEDYYFTVIIVVGSITVLTCIVVIVIGVICIKRINNAAAKQKESDANVASYLPMKNANSHNNPFQTLTSQPGPTAGHCEWQNGTMLSNNSGGTEAAQYFILDKDYMDNMYTLQARQ